MKVSGTALHTGSCGGRGPEFERGSGGVNPGLGLVSEAGPLHSQHTGVDAVPDEVLERRREALRRTRPRSTRRDHRLHQPMESTEHRHGKVQIAGEWTAQWA